MRKRHRYIGALGSALLWLACSLAAGAEPEAPPQSDLTPPRLSFIEGQASFWRPGAEDWTPAQVNTPLWPGDVLYSAQRANLEIQVGARAFVRLAEKTQLSLVNHEPDLLQLQLTSGEASLDLRSLPPGQAVELDTPGSVFTIDQPGYYRAAILGDGTHFTTRRGGRATSTTADGQSHTISPSEEVVVQGRDGYKAVTYVAPEPDAWDRWNYGRTDHEVEAVSARYVPPDVYGVSALDHYGSWRVVPSYGTVWVPQRVAPGWAPYTTGSWIFDPFYGWTWVDNSPWGWAPYHYGRWVFVNGLWAWAPGPVIARPVYAPALVAFFGLGSGVSVRVGIGGAGVGWVPLGWGEPLRPWWGRPGFVGVPSWRGWGGPRVVNNVVINQTNVVNVNNIVYQNTRVSNAVVAVNESQFGRGPVRGARLANWQPHEVEPIHGALPVKPGPASLVAGTGRAVRPPERIWSNPVVATRPPREVRLPWNGEGQRGRPAVAGPERRIVAPEKQPDTSEALPRPSFATQGPERPRPPFPQRFEDMKRSGPSPAKGPDGRVTGESAPPAAAPGASPPAEQATPPQTESRREGRSTQESRAAAPVSPPTPQATPPQPESRREGRSAQESRAAAPVSPPAPQATPPQPESRREGPPSRESRAAPIASPPAPQATPPQSESRRDVRPSQESRAAAPIASPPGPQATLPKQESRREGRSPQESRAAPPGATLSTPRAASPQTESRREVHPAQGSRAAAPAASPPAPRAATPQPDLGHQGRAAQQSHALPGRPANEQYPGRARGKVNTPESDRRNTERR